MSSSRTRDPSSQAAPEADAQPEHHDTEIEKTIKMFDGPEGGHMLAKMIVMYPAQRGEILAAAHKYMGNDAIRRALEEIEGPKADPRFTGKPTERAFPHLVDDGIATLERGDVKVLVTIFRAHPGQRERIIQQATEQTDADTVKQALSVLDAEQPKAALVPQEAPPQGVIAKPAEAPLAAAKVEEPTPAKVIEKQVEEKVPTKAEQAPPSAAPAQTQPAQEQPGWVTRAIAFNAERDDDVSLFNLATMHCCVGADGVVDPYLVARWQADHGMHADGRVGVKTLECAALSQRSDLEAPVPSVTRPEPNNVA